MQILMNLTSSPWGKVQTQKELAPGIIAVTTASHGGIWVAPDKLEKMPIKATGYSYGGWFEEDCDWALVALAFPEAFDAESVAIAEKMKASDYFKGMGVQ